MCYAVVFTHEMAWSRQQFALVMKSSSLVSILVAIFVVHGGVYGDRLYLYSVVFCTWRVRKPQIPFLEYRTATAV